MKTELKTREGGIWDAPILALKIHQKEGLKALCDIEMARLGEVSSRNDIPDYLEVWIDGACQFKGQVTGVLEAYTPHTMKIELTCHPHESEDPLCRPEMDPHFREDDDCGRCFSTPNEHLPHIHHYDRINCTRDQAHLLNAAQTLSVPTNQILHYQSTHQPLPTGIDLVVEAKWRWQRIDRFDLWAAIKSQCGGEFATLTPDAFIKKWEKALHMQPQTGYSVLYNKLFIQKPRYAAAAGKRIKGGVVDGQCIIEARQEQKCHEITHYAIGENYTQRKRLHLKVPISEHDETTFFETETGQQWLQRAQAIAHNHFLAINRQKRIVITAVLTTKEMEQLTLDTALVVEAITGRICEYAITNNGEGYVCRVVVCGLVDGVPPTCHPGNASALSGTQEKYGPQDSLGSRFRGNDNVDEHHHYIQDLDIHNHFDQQSVAIKAMTDPGPLRLPVTAVYLQLKDLRPIKREPKLLDATAPLN